MVKYPITRFLNYLLVFLKIVLRHLAINSGKKKNSFQKRGARKFV